MGRREGVPIGFGIFSLPGPQGSPNARDVDDHQGLSEVFRCIVRDDSHQGIGASSRLPRND